MSNQPSTNPVNHSSTKSLTFPEFVRDRDTQFDALALEFIDIGARLVRLGELESAKTALREARRCINQRLHRSRKG